MSNRPAKEPSVEELLVRAEELKQYLNVLNATINNYVNQYRELQLAGETLKNLPESGGEGYTILDRLSMVLVPITIDPAWKAKVLVNLGLGYYLKSDRDKALAIVSKRIAELERLINELQARYRQYLQEYSAIQDRLAAFLGKEEETKG